jgi:hypothetical protein
LSAVVHEVTVPLAWHWIERVRELVAESLADQSEELREAAVMVASELAENLVKYGHGTGGVDSGRVRIEVSATDVTILSENGAPPEQASRVQAVIGKMQGRDVAQLYMDRLTEMAARPGEAESELGLLRIAFEGGFALTCTYVEPNLSIRATRSIGS